MVGKLLRSFIMFYSLYIRRRGEATQSCILIRIEIFASPRRSSFTIMGLQMGLQSVALLCFSVVLGIPLRRNRSYAYWFQQQQQHAAAAAAA